MRRRIGLSLPGDERRVSLRPPHRAHPRELPHAQRVRLPAEDRRRPRQQALQLRAARGARAPPRLGAARSGDEEARPGRVPLPEHPGDARGTLRRADLTGVRVVRVDDTGAVGEPYEEFLATASPDPVESWLDDEDETISINYTSGTTGRPKGGMYSHRGAWINAVGEVIEAHMSFDTKYL